MATSETEICNLALQQLGAARIISLAADSVEARLCSDFYTLLRDELLRSHPWKFATKRIDLARATPTPEFGFDFYYQLPTDCLRVLKVDGDETYGWTVEGTYLLTDDDTATIKYISNNIQVGMFTSDFVTALALKLAYKLSYALVQSNTLRESIYKEYLEAVRVARSFNGQEGAGDRVYSDNWLNSRY